MKGRTKETELKTWIKFKHWLIKKLGGHVHQNVIAFRCVENEPLTLLAASDVRFDFHCMDGEQSEHIERKIKEDLAFQIMRELLKHNLLEIEKAEDPIYRVTRYRAKLMVYANKGAKNEQRKAD